MITLSTAQYAAILSTFLLVIKLYELARDRFRLDAYLTVDGRESDKEVVITNLSSKAIHIKYFELYWASTGWFSKKNHIPIDHDFATKSQIGAYSTKSLAFTEEHNFGLKPGKKLYIRLHIAGQKFKRIKKIY
jgi:hypothetical protein